MGDDLQLLARILTAPFRLVKSLFQTVVMTLAVLTFLLVAPFVSLLTMPDYQRQANEAISDRNKSHVLIDFSTNTLIAIPGPGYRTHLTTLPTDVDYKSLNASTLAHVSPATFFAPSSASSLLLGIVEQHAMRLHLSPPIVPRLEPVRHLSSHHWRTIFLNWVRVNGHIERNTPQPKSTTD